MIKFLYPFIWSIGFPYNVRLVKLLQFPRAVTFPISWILFPWTYNIFKYGNSHISLCILVNLFLEISIHWISWTLLNFDVKDNSGNSDSRTKWIPSIVVNLLFETLKALQYFLNFIFIFLSWFFLLSSFFVKVLFDSLNFFPLASFISSLNLPSYISFDSFLAFLGFNCSSSSFFFLSVSFVLSFLSSFSSFFLFSFLFPLVGSLSINSDKVFTSKKL